MTISNDQAENDRVSQQPDWASAPAHPADQPVGEPTEHVYTDRDQQLVGEPGLDRAPATDERLAPATAAESLNGTVGSERHAATERPAETNSAIGAEQVEVSDSDRGSVPSSAAHGDSAVSDSLFEGDLAGLRSRWNDVQAAFVDDPRDCVQRADGLVSDVVDQLTANFSQTRTRLEEQWDRGEEASTEDLRVALQGYRQFFERLLSV